MPARPLRPGETPPKGTAVIKGQVRAEGSGTPVRRAQVRATSMDGRGGGVTSTDNQGSFEIRDLAAGRYSISANKGGYVTGQFGQRRPGEPGTPIELSDGQTAEKVNFVLSRGGVISGRIVDDGGEPVAGTMVSAMRFQFMGGTRRLVPSGGMGMGGSDTTDDQGVYRLYGLPPGDYFVSANNRNMGFMSGPEMTNTEQDGFAPTYFPGTASVSDATRITVKPGQEVSAPFALIVARMAKIRGRVLNSRGEPVGRTMLMLVPADDVFGGMAFSTANNAMVGADGAFQFTNVAPGRYNLNVRPMNMPGQTGEFATMPITVGNEDIDGVLISTSLGATARGVIITDDATPPPFRFDQVQVFASSTEPGNQMMGGGMPRVNEDYTFELTNLFDRRILRGFVGAGGGSSLGWQLKAVMYDGHDVIDSGIDFTPGRTYEGLQIVFTQRVTDLSGLVSDDRNRPVLDATVVIFPADREKWGFQTRYIRSARPDTNGRYNVKNLPPFGDYLVIAVRNLESGQATDPDFLTRAREEAKPFSLTDAETKSVDIRLSTLIP
jgi:protocatechuate 3,4-dioxygenase beta subunit